MIDTLKIYEQLQESMEASAAHKIAEVIGMVYQDLQNTVTKKEFGELKDVVQDLAEAQKRTEQRVDELAEAQKRTEQRLEQLARAQEKTEIELRNLVKEHRKLYRSHEDTQAMLAGLSDNWGYTLENEAYKALPKLLKRDFSIVTKGRLKREYVEDKTGQFIELNIVGQGRQNGKELFIAGECKSKLSQRKVDEFIKKKLKRIERKSINVFPVLVTHMISNHGVEEYVRKQGIALYYSYDF